MNIILSMATSANGMIATSDGSEDFFSDENWNRFVALAKRTKGFVWGRKTYESVIAWEGDYLDELKDVKKIIVSKSDISLRDGFTLAHSPEEAIQIASDAGLQDLVVTGGATINTEFAKRGLIDEVIFDINPSVVGNGIPIFMPAEFEIKLQLQGIEPINEDIVEVRYMVNR